MNNKKVNIFLVHADLADESSEMNTNDNASVSTLRVEDAELPASLIDTENWTDTETVTSMVTSNSTRRHQNPQPNQNQSRQSITQPTNYNQTTIDHQTHLSNQTCTNNRNTNLNNNTSSSAPMYIEAGGADYGDCSLCCTTNAIASRDICEARRDVDRLNQKLKENDEDVEKLKSKVEKLKNKRREEAEKAEAALAHAETKKNEEKKEKEKAQEKVKALEATVRSERRGKREIAQQKEIVQRRLDAAEEHKRKMISYQNQKNQQNNGDVKHYKVKCENFRFHHLTSGATISGPPATSSTPVKITGLDDEDDMEVADEYDSGNQ